MLEFLVREQVGKGGHHLPAFGPGEKVPGFPGTILISLIFVSGEARSPSCLWFYFIKCSGFCKCSGAIICGRGLRYLAMVLGNNQDQMKRKLILSLSLKSVCAKPQPGFLAASLAGCGSGVPVYSFFSRAVSSRALMVVSAPSIAPSM